MLNFEIWEKHPRHVKNIQQIVLKVKWTFLTYLGPMHSIEAEGLFEIQIFKSVPTSEAQVIQLISSFPLNQHSHELAQVVLACPWREFGDIFLTVRKINATMHRRISWSPSYLKFEYYFFSGWGLIFHFRSGGGFFCIGFLQKIPRFYATEMKGVRLDWTQTKFRCPVFYEQHCRPSRLPGTDLSEGENHL